MYKQVEVGISSSILIRCCLLVKEARLARMGCPIKRQKKPMLEAFMAGRVDIFLLTRNKSMEKIVLMQRLELKLLGATAKIRAQEVQEE